MTSSYTFVGKTTLTKSSAYRSIVFSSANMGTLTTINMYWQHGRSVTEIWGKDEIKNVECAPPGGGDETKNLDLFGDEI